MIPREPPADYPSLFRVERDRLLALLRALSWRLLTNNYRVEQHGSVSTTGDPTIVSTLLNTRAMIGTPK